MIEALLNVSNTAEAAIQYVGRMHAYAATRSLQDKMTQVQRVVRFLPHAVKGETALTCTLSPARTPAYKHAVCCDVHVPYSLYLAAAAISEMRKLRLEEWKNHGCIDHRPNAAEAAI